MTLFEMAQIIKLNDKYGVVIQQDYDKDHVLFRVFNNYEDAYMWVHDVSLKQNPLWHAEHCDICVTKGTVAP